MRRFKVTIVYEVDIAAKAEGMNLAISLGHWINAHTRGDDIPVRVEEVDFSFKQITHPKDSDA